MKELTKQQFLTLSKNKKQSLITNACLWLDLTTKPNRVGFIMFCWALYLVFYVNGDC